MRLDHLLSKEERSKEYVVYCLVIKRVPERACSHNKIFWWRCAWGKHPYPSRTRWLRPRRPMVLCWRRHGRAGGCRIKKENKFLLKDFISDPSTKESFVFEWLITSVRHVPWKLHTNTICIYSEPSRFEGKTMSHACMNEAFWRRSYLASSHIEMKQSGIEMRIWIKSRY